MAMWSIVRKKCKSVGTGYPVWRSQEWQDGSGVLRKRIIARQLARDLAIEELSRRSFFSRSREAAEIMPPTTSRLRVSARHFLQQICVALDPTTATR